MDFFIAKRIQDKEGTLYIRKGKTFLYVGAERFEIGNDPDKDDVTYKGTLVLFQQDEYYMLSLNTASKVVVLKCGNGLEELG